MRTFREVSLKSPYDKAKKIPPRDGLRLFILLYILVFWKLLITSWYIRYISMFETFLGRFLQNCYWFCICATTALSKNGKYRTYSNTESSWSLTWISQTHQEWFQNTGKWSPMLFIRKFNFSTRILAFLRYQLVKDLTLIWVAGNFTPYVLRLGEIFWLMETFH